MNNSITKGCIVVLEGSHYENKLFRVDTVRPDNRFNGSRIDNPQTKENIWGISPQQVTRIVPLSDLQLLIQ